MPRDINGNFSLVAGNPVAPGTIIESDWANTTLDDIASAMTNSLSRTGAGGMLVPFKNADGTLLNPGMTWVNAPNSGIYRNSTRMGFVWQGVEHFALSAGAIEADVPFLAANGTVSLPGQAWLSDGTSGFFKDATHIGFVWQGVEYASLSAAGLNLTTPTTFPNGTESTPGIAWTTSLNTGFFYNGAVMGATWNGGAVWAIDADGMGFTAGKQLAADFGIVSKPGFTFLGIGSSGLFADTSHIGFVWNGVEYASLSAAGFVGGGGGGGGTFADGTAALPGIAFTSQLSTGIYRTATKMGFSYGGTEFASVNGSGLATTTLTAAVGVTAPTVTASGSVEAARLNVTAAAIPANGLYLPAASTPALSSAGSSTIKWNATGEVSMGKGSNPYTGAGLNISGPAAGSTIVWGMSAAQQVQPTVSNTYVGVTSNPGTAPGGWNLPNCYQFNATFAGKGAGSTITKMVGFRADNTLTGATNVAGFESNVPNLGGHIAFYESAGTDSAFAGGLLLASTTAAPAGGSARNSIRIGSTGNTGLYFGSGAPAYAAGDGSMYLNTTGAVGSAIWIRLSGVWTLVV